MSFSSRSLWFSALAFITCTARAELSPTLKELLAQMRTEVQADMKAARDNDRGLDRQWQLSASLLQVETALKDCDYDGGYNFNQLLASVQTMATSERMRAARRSHRAAARTTHRLRLATNARRP